VLIMTDDAGYGDFGSYGAPDVRTPNIDAIGREGVRLTDFYANGATCTPTRAGLISGRYQQRFALEAPLQSQGEADWVRGLPATGGSLPQLLKQRGYATALVGKWHLGWRDEFSPKAHGFDYFFGFKSAFVDYYQHTAGPNAPGPKDLFENERAVEVPGYMTDLITRRSVAFIERHADRPFFIDVAYSAPHWPYQPPDRPSTARENGRHLTPLDTATSTRADYVAMLERVDQGVGEILRTLDRLGLRQNTLVIFTNDNGGEWLSRNAPLFHHKGSVWEGGIRVPAMVRWPARIPPNRVSRQVGITMDLTATILAAAGAAATARARHEGIDLLPAIAGDGPEVDRTLFWRISGARPQGAVRSGNWKLVMDGARPLLFDLRADVAERENLVGARSDVARRLQALLGAWHEDVNAEAQASTQRTQR
jgi:arylsulfatase A-like enzyme